MRPHPPRFVWLYLLVAVVVLASAAVLAYQASTIIEAEKQRDCQRAVATREDGRAMWLYLAENSTEDPQRVTDFLVVLNERLPPLRCEDGNPVPIPPG